MWNCCTENFGEYLVYTTKKELRVQNRCIAGVYLFGMLTIFVYVVAYTLIIEKGYQAIGYPTGYVSTKVKGLAFNHPNEHNNETFYESVDLVLPAVEMDGLFLATAAVKTWQERGSCAGNHECDYDDNCTAGEYD